MVPKNLRVAIVCDWLLGIGGGERVVLELHRMFPEAPIYTSQYNPSKIDWFKDADVRTTWLQKLPGGLKKFLPVLRAQAFSRLDLSQYDVVISATGAEAKGIRTGPQTKHICYCFAPTHYYWSRYDQYMKNPGFGAFNWLARLGLSLLVGPMRRWDKRAAQRPDYMISISSHIQKEIKKYYDRESTIIHPPVDTKRFQTSAAGHQSVASRQGFVTAGRQTAYKRIDLAVTACTQLNLHLVVIGNGPEHTRLVKMAGPTVSFQTSASDSDVATYFETAEAFIFPGLDDFGIVAVEAMAAGAPVIAYKAGGALDYVVEGQTGSFFTDQTNQSLEAALQKFHSASYRAEIIQEKAETFDTKQFEHHILDYLSKIVL